MIIVDTNIISYLFIKGENTETAKTLLRSDPKWSAPILWKSEFRNVLALYLRKGFFSIDQVFGILHEAELFMQNNEYEVNSDDVINLVARSNCSAYDCEFIALAQEFGSNLITLDQKLIKTFPNSTVSLHKIVESL